MTHFIDESFWVAICFIAFVFMAYRPVKRAIVNSLDSRIEEIKKTMYDAQKLKDDAKIILEQIELEMRSFEDRKRRILESAETSTARLVETKTKEIDLQIRRMRDSVSKTIESMKNKASAELQEEFTDHVLGLVREYLSESKNNGVKDEEIINNLIGKK